MKIIIAFILLGFMSCSSSKGRLDNSQLAEIDQVYYQKWAAGINGGGSGINFHVHLKTALEKEDILEKVMFVSYISYFKKISATEYIATIKIPNEDFILDENPINEYGNLVRDHLLKLGEANLFFRKNGEEIIKNLQNVKEKPMIAYPSMEKPKN